MASGLNDHVWTIKELIEKAAETVSEESKIRWYTFRGGKVAWAEIRRIRFSLKTLLIVMTIPILVFWAYRVGRDRGYRQGYDSGTRDTTIRWNYAEQQAAIARSEYEHARIERIIGATLSPEARRRIEEIANEDKK